MKAVALAMAFAALAAPAWAHNDGCSRRGDAAVTIVKKRWPSLNANGLLDDTLTTLRDMIATDPPNQ